MVELVTDNRDGRCELVPPLGVVEPSRRCGIRDGVASSVLSSDNDEPWRDGGFEPGREFGFEPPTFIRIENTFGDKTKQNV